MPELVTAKTGEPLVSVIVDDLRSKMTAKLVVTGLGKLVRKDPMTLVMYQT